MPPPRRAALLGCLLVALVLLAGAAARAHRPPAFGDSLTVRTETTAPADRFALSHGALEAYDARTGARLWSYRRRAARAWRLVPVAGGAAVAVWSDGMLTAVQPGRSPVRWHRSVPDLRAGGDPAVVAPISGGSVLLVLAPHLVLLFRTADGSIHWDTQPPPGCAFRPDRALPADGGYVLPLSCPPGGPSSLESFDGNGFRWTVPASPADVPLPLGGHRLAVRRPGPALLPRVLDARTGRLVPPCTAPPAARLAAGGCADAAR